MPGTDRLSRRRVYASIAILVGTAFLVLYAGLIFIVGTGFFLEIEADSWQVFAALSIACAVVLFLGKQVLGWRETIAALLIFLVLLGFSVAIAGYFIDISWDGRNYHALAVRLLRDGWNPVSDPYHQSGWNTLTWIDHFAKGAWYFSAPIIDLTGNPETGKASNLLLAIVVFCLVFAYLLSYTRVSLPASILISLLPVLNPVISTQLLTRYVDGQVAAIFTILLLLGLFAAHRTDTLQLVAWFAAIVIGINIKFTSAAYTAGLLVLIGAGLFWLKRKDLQSLIPLAITVFFSSLVGLLVVGYNPYVRNTLSFGHPLYPVYGSQAAEIREKIILGANVPEVLRRKDRFQKLGISLFSRSENLPQDPAVRIKLPFTVSEQELETFTATGTRIAGFGPLFGGVLLLAVLGLFAVRLEPDALKIFLWVLGVILLLTLLNNEGWWARYAPQVWLVPIVILVALLHSKSSWSAAIGWVLVLVLLINAVLVLAVNLDFNFTQSMQAKRTLTQLLSTQEEIYVFQDLFISTEETLDAYGIPYTIVASIEDIPCEKQPLTYATMFSTADCGMDRLP